jgi:hypothetical protein
LKNILLTRDNYEYIINDIEKQFSRKSLIHRKYVISFLSSLLANSNKSTIKLSLRNEIFIEIISDSTFFIELYNLQNSSKRELDDKFRESIKKKISYYVEMCDLARILKKIKGEMLICNEKISIRIPNI